MVGSRDPSLPLPVATTVTSPPRLAISGNILHLVLFESSSLTVALARSRPLPSRASLDLLTPLLSFSSSDLSNHRCIGCLPPPMDPLTMLATAPRAPLSCVLSAERTWSRSSSQSRGSLWVAPLVPSDTLSLPQEGSPSPSTRNAPITVVGWRRVWHRGCCCRGWWLAVPFIQRRGQYQRWQCQLP